MTRVFSPSISSVPFRMALPLQGRAVLDDAMLPVSINISGGARTPRAEAQPGDTIAVSMSEALVDALKSGNATATTGWAVLIGTDGNLSLVTPEQADAVMTASAAYDRDMELNSAL